LKEQEKIDAVIYIVIYERFCLWVAYSFY